MAEAVTVNLTPPPPHRQCQPRASSVGQRGLGQGVPRKPLSQSGREGLLEEAASELTPTGQVGVLEYGRFLINVN